jgi:hypothetical protein
MKPVQQIDVAESFQIFEAALKLSINDNLADNAGGPSGLNGHIGKFCKGRFNDSDVLHGRFPGG